jgi:acyl-CoA synthetase (NDP forming)
VRAGLSISRFEPATTAKLREALPATANLRNPVDVIGDARADRYMVAIEAVLADPNVDQVLVILTPQSMTDIESIAEGVRQIQSRALKPIACSLMGAADVASGIHLLQQAHIPHYILPEWCCRAMADVIVQITQATDRTIKCLRTMDPGFHEHAVEVNRLENSADNLLRDSLAALFDEQGDPIEVIKWKEIYETMEIVTDRCEDVANVIEGIILKMA